MDNAYYTDPDYYYRAVERFLLSFRSLFSTLADEFSDEQAEELNTMFYAMKNTPDGIKDYTSNVYYAEKILQMFDPFSMMEHVEHRFFDMQDQYEHMELAYEILSNT